jgi:hypothetical protein
MGDCLPSRMASVMSGREKGYLHGMGGGEAIALGVVQKPCQKAFVRRP